MKSVPFIEGPLLAPDQIENYMQPDVSTESATVLEHCARAIDRSLQLGEHGLPLMGSGDWNDGMNRVGVEGKGESVWLGWFLCTVLGGFAPLCERYQMTERSKRYGQHVEKLEKDSSRRGTATGIGAPILTTARRSVQRRTTSAGSIPSLRRGR